MQALQVIFLCCVALTAAEVDKISEANFTTIAELPKSRAIGARSTLRVSNFAANWNDAMGYCYQTGSVFVSISDHLFDQTVRQGLLAQRVSSPVFTSGRFSYTGEPLHLELFMWAGNGQQVIYNNWNTIYGEPNNMWGYNTCLATRAAGYMETQYKWEAANCDSPLLFLCLA